MEWLTRLHDPPDVDLPNRHYVFLFRQLKSPETINFSPSEKAVNSLNHSLTK